MKYSVFNLNDQNQKIESRIIVALERISQAFRVLLWKESKENSLSPIQIQILIFICFHSKEKCKITYLAEEFNMTKSTISDSVKILITKGLIEKKSNLVDTRSFWLVLTEEGYKIALKASFLLLLYKIVWKIC
ncbi:MarR family winged helix-turn-helix transcriptional regulator [Flavobacterium oreochromis]|uniref:MarR family winged helix-turn-helix transcriptional regulator n=1 Tax=Flavobacterium oreochromis TaxID=2906078 RepID=UPI0021645F99|nr:MarR family winged helix-turn-helix transcriptional regulator [Flavobacterium oreochromis]